MNYFGENWKKSDFLDHETPFRRA